MSFRLSDLKKSVRIGRDGYQVTPARLEGRPALFRIEFLLQQFEGHLGCPRRMLDPHSLLEFVGDHRLGRGLLATLSQWYRVRPRTFPELLEDGGARLREAGINGPIDLRAWLYAAVNRTAPGYLDPESEALFWQRQARAFGYRRQDLQKLMLLDRPEEAVLVRTGPPPTTADVMAAYNARAHTTLLRSAMEISLVCNADSSLIERAARTWAGALEVEWRIETGMLKLAGRADALGCWTRHGRRVERAALELLALPELALREIRGHMQVGERRCHFRWTAGTLAQLGTGSGALLDESLPEQVDALAAALRLERERRGDAAWSIRRPGHLVGVEGGVILPHLELRRGDLTLYLRMGDETAGAGRSKGRSPFAGKTPVVLVSGAVAKDGVVVLQPAGEAPRRCSADDLLASLGEWASGLASVAGVGSPQLNGQPARRAA